MNYKIISSCSSGNATIIRDIILIDCGVTFKRLEKYYKKLKLECGVERKNIDVLKIGTRYDYKLFKVVPIKLYHDVPQCGYRVLFDDYKVIYMTDTKTVEGITAKDYDLYLIEGNYDEDEIEERIKEKQQDWKYVYEFRAKESHLSKQQASEFLLNNMSESSEYVFMHQHVERKKDNANNTE